MSCDPKGSKGKFLRVSPIEGGSQGRPFLGSQQERERALAGICTLSIARKSARSGLAVSRLSGAHGSKIHFEVTDPWPASIQRQM